MLEMAEQEKEEKIQDLKEEIMDVTKQRDMMGFYKHRLNRLARVPAVPEPEKEPESKPKESEESIQKRALEARAQFKQKGGFELIITLHLS